MYGILNAEIDGVPVRKVIPSHKGDYGQYYKNLYDTIVNGKPLSEKAEHGYNTIRIIELAFESHEQKKTLACSGLK